MIKVNNKRLAVGATVLMALLLLYSIYSVAISFISHDNYKQQTTKASSLQLLKLPNIAAWHLFGVYQNGILPQTQLELTLAGVFVSDIGQQSQALIGVPGSIAKLYNVGQIVPGGAKITKILANGVTLKHNGKLETLPLIRPKLIFAPKPRGLINL